YCKTIKEDDVLSCCDNDEKQLQKPLTLLADKSKFAVRILLLLHWWSCWSISSTMVFTRASNQRTDQPLEEPPSTASTSSAQESALRVTVAKDIVMPAFSGRPEEDGNRWLDMFLRFAVCRCWRSAYKLMFVVYYLRDTALIWFENQNFQLWDSLSKVLKKFMA